MTEAIVYSSTNCHYCAQLKQYLKDQNIAYEERNIDTNAEYAKQLEGMGLMSVPVTVIGEMHILGLNPTRIKKALAAAAVQ
ncbi:glutaredoxin family protein [Paenibacillus mesophilus]|uniref:glutaredoxin family protein n=1 Tax=Paenibacillus mesophilus TaxID=2582849 RepID=UPI00110E4346|nr:glutaredoxin family protein [Paenibacillus mesophilus]TMV47480.1 glutaredoxin family protein [Paenibacillus mesophilus]